MSECLGPPLSVYPSPVVIYSSPLVLYSCHLLDAFLAGIFKCFIYMTIYFHSFSEHVATIISPELSVIFLDRFFNQFFVNNVLLHPCSVQLKSPGCVGAVSGIFLKLLWSRSGGDKMRSAQSLLVY